MGLNELLILTGALAGGFVSGLAGFGTGLTALPFWLSAVPPVVAAPIVVICSIVAQAQTIPVVWHAIVWRDVLPYILGGLIGVPIGTLLLAHISLQGFKLVIGCFLVVFSSFMLLRRSAPKITWGGNAANGVVGFAGGILGGLAGLSGPIPTIWASLKDWGKDQKRSVFQAFNLPILILAAATQAYGGFMTLEVGRLVLIALPGTLLGAWLGRRTYEKVGTDRFNQIILLLLFLSGASTIVSTVLID